MKNLQIVPVKGQEMINTTAKLANEIWHQHFTPIIGIDQVEYMIDKFQSVPALTKQLEEGYEYFLILSDGKPAGYSGIHVKENSLFLSKLYVHENYRGNKISTQVLDFYKKLCQERGLEKIWLTCNKHNENTLAVYRHLGFVTVRSQKADIGQGFVMDDYVMELKV